MFQMRGKYNTANIFIDEVDETTMKQIQGMLNHPAFKGTYIAIMPDTHAGKGSVVGFTMTLTDYVIPNIVGVDIGCGIEAVNVGKEVIDFERLDKFIKTNVPCGFRIHKEAQIMLPDFFSYIEIAHKIKYDSTKFWNSIGTLGGGNHFIEVDKDGAGNHWLVIHSGSRGFGLAVAKYHQNKAKELMRAMFVGAHAYRDLEYLPMEHGGKEYLYDMWVAQEYASHNRNTMFSIIIKGFFNKQLQALERVSSVHNYIDFTDKVIRKGAIQANAGQRCIIPFNMRDGVAICKGKGTKKYNCSAPHGAGRILSRTKAKEILDADEFKEQMKGIYTTTAVKSTLDESPSAYKDMNLILQNITETVDVEFMMKPVYNFKAA